MSVEFSVNPHLVVPIIGLLPDSDFNVQDRDLSYWQYRMCTLHKHVDGRRFSKYEYNDSYTFHVNGIVYDPIRGTMFSGHGYTQKVPITEKRFNLLMELLDEPEVKSNNWQKLYFNIVKLEKYKTILIFRDRIKSHIIISFPKYECVCTHYTDLICPYCNGISSFTFGTLFEIYSKQGPWVPIIEEIVGHFDQVSQMSDKMIQNTLSKIHVLPLNKQRDFIVDYLEFHNKQLINKGKSARSV